MTRSVTDIAFENVNPGVFWGSALAVAAVIFLLLVGTTMWSSSKAGKLCVKEHPKYTKAWDQCVDDYVKGKREFPKEEKR